MRMLLTQSVSREAVAAALEWRGEELEVELSLVLAHASEGEADVVTAEAEGIGQHCFQC